ncbi:MAG TPA: rRNA maturation RNase YbeY [Abditibacteriaceae bacterium]
MQQTLATTPPDKSRNEGRSKSTVLSVDISLVDDAEIHELNSGYRGKNKPTDVLSFAFDDGEDFSAAFPGAPVSLGDIIISIETAARQAEERGHEIDEELAFLAVHGALHLLGYDHDVAARRNRMWAAQKRVMESLKPYLNL